MSDEEDNIEENVVEDDNVEDGGEDGGEDVEEDDETAKEEFVDDEPIQTRDIIVVAPEDRITSNMMTMGEVARVVALMAQLISKNPGDYENTTETDPIEIAKKLLLARKIPFKIQRQVGVTAKKERIVEEWNVRDMAYPIFV